MKSLKLALLAAAAVLVVAPAAATMDSQDRPERHGGRDGGFGDGGFGDGGQRGGMRPTPPQAQFQPRPQPQQQTSEPQLRTPQQRGDWGNGNRFGGRDAGQRAQWNANRNQADQSNLRPTPPQANVQAQQPNRGDWNRGGNGQFNRDDRQRGGRDFGNGRDGRGNDGRWNRGGNRDWNGNGAVNGNGGDNRWGNDQRRDNDNRWNNNDRRDRRWDNDNRGRDDRRWDRNRGDSGWNHDRRGNGRRPDLNWRNDRRYDWRGWRNTHREIFRRGHYNPPYGYGYRSVYRGFFLEPLFYSSSYWLADPYEYRLPPLEWPYQWVRYYDDALLVDTTTGEVVDVIQSFFY